MPRAILYLVFTLSGLAGLVYEATWTRYLQLFLGHAAYAQVLVLALFMGGMGAGALAAARLGARFAPLTAYAAIEGALGLFAFAFHPLFVALTRFAYGTLLPGTLESATGQVEQWTLAAAMILPQSILLGMTFPLMSAAILRLGAPQSGRVFAMLYFTNSIGAVIGVLAAGFWLVESEGLQSTLHFAGYCNLVVAAVAFLISRRRAPAVPPVQRTARGEGAGGWLLGIAFFTAVSSFLYEIGWLRMLALVQGASTHAFETMLSAFILGLALGGLWIRFRIGRYASPLSALASVQVLMGIAALATLPAYPFTFDAMAAALPWLRSQPAGYAEYNALGWLLSAAIMVPASFCAGMTLPLLTQVLYERGRGESEIGAVYGWNTLGSIAGVALGGLVLMPLVGLKNLIVLGSAIDIAIGVALFAWLARSRALAAPRFAMAVSGVAALALGLALFAFELDPQRLASGVFRTGKATLAAGSTLLHYADGRTASISVERQAKGVVSISTNGKPDAGIQMGTPRAGDASSLPGPDEFTMTLLAALPLAHAPAAREAAVIGHGSGLSTHVLLGSPVLQHVDVIEIEPEMIRAARLFLPRVERAYTDPRAQYHIEDARAFFARTPRRYDIVVSEPSNPWVSGVASLYTPEFYRQARSALAPGGLFVQWFHLYEIDRPMVRSIVGALGQVFSDYMMYASNGNDFVVIATATGTVPPLTGAPFDWPGTRSDLERLDIRSLDQLRMFAVASRKAYAPLLEGWRVNTDYFPVLEFGAARARFRDRDDADLIGLARDPMPILEIMSGFPPPAAVPESALLPYVSARYLDLHEGSVLLRAVIEGPDSPTARSLPDQNRGIVAILNQPPGGNSEQEWNRWMLALLALSKPLLPNGGWPAMEAYLRSAPVAAAVARAPAATREKFEFLTQVGRRDLAGIRARGRQMLGGTLEKDDPAFFPFVFVATLTACLANSKPDSDCQWVITQLDRVRRDNIVFDLLREHRRALQLRGN